MTILLVTLWIGLSIVVGYAARSRGRSPLAWGAVALILSPLLAILILIAFPPVYAASAAPAPIDRTRGRVIGGAVLVALIALAIVAAQMA